MMYRPQFKQKQRAMRAHANGSGCASAAPARLLVPLATCALLVSGAGSAFGEAVVKPAQAPAAGNVLLDLIEDPDLNRFRAESALPVSQPAREAISALNAPLPSQSGAAEASAASAQPSTERAEADRVAAQTAAAAQSASASESGAAPKSDLAAKIRGLVSGSLAWLQQNSALALLLAGTVLAGGLAIFMGRRRRSTRHEALRERVAPSLSAEAVEQARAASALRQSRRKVENPAPIAPQPNIAADEPISLEAVFSGLKPDVLDRLRPLEAAEAVDLLDEAAEGRSNGSGFARGRRRRHQAHLNRLVDEQRPTGDNLDAVLHRLQKMPSRPGHGNLQTEVNSLTRHRLKRGGSHQASAQERGAH
ncbi:MAG: hypothetical protein MRY63_05575 [Neomegalonema sp.]|nr:hypothetical protein [Neomegalonema sp.]